MGKASSTKKVQRAARAGGRVSSGQPRSLLFPGVLTLVVVLGLALVWFARQDRLDDDQGGTPQIGDHIHQAFGVNVCGEWKLDLPEFSSDTVGIHSHGDGVIHIHPHSQLGVGSNATLGRFLEEVRNADLDAEIDDTQLDWLEETFKEGETECDGVDDPQLLVAFWANASDTESLPEIRTGDFNDLRLTDNGAAITIFYGDPDAEIPKPNSAANLAALGAADGAEVTTSTTAAGGSTSSTSTTVGGSPSSTSTTAP
jgi:hypothetical protein